MKSMKDMNIPEQYYTWKGFNSQLRHKEWSILHSVPIIVSSYSQINAHPHKRKGQHRLTSASSLMNFVLICCGARAFKCLSIILHEALSKPIKIGNGMTNPHVSSI